MWDVLNQDHLPEKAAAIVLASALLAEWLHVRRVRHLSYLAFGPTGKARSWTRLAPWIRCLALTTLVWGWVTLVGLKPKVFTPREREDHEFHRLVIALDVSPSMQLKDAGLKSDKTRAQRAGALLESALSRVALDQIRMSLIAVYNGAKRVVVDTRDADVIRNILNDLPMDQAFESGQTQLFAGIQEAADLAREWDKDSATLAIVSDGDTVPKTGMPTLPPSIGQVLVVGVGNVRTGTYIDGRLSRQDQSTLRQIARRLGGVYHDGNFAHLPTETLKSLSESLPLKEEMEYGQREWALAALALGTLALVGMPVALTRFGVKRKV